MINPLNQLGLLCCIVACATSTAAAQYHAWGHYDRPCPCGDYAPTSPPRAPVYQHYRHAFPNYQPQVDSRPVERSPVVRSAPVRPASQQAPQLYSPEEEHVLFHPVVVPLDEFLRPGAPAALSPKQLARQRAAAEDRARLGQPPQVGAPAVPPPPDPFADDAPAPGETPEAPEPSPPAVTAEEPMEPAEADAFAEEPEADAAPDAEAPPPTEPAEAEEDPFDSFE